MTRNDLARHQIDSNLIERLVVALEALADSAQAPRCYTLAEAGELLGKTENWVIEAIQDRRIPFTYIGRSRFLTAEHIRAIQKSGEVQPRSLRAA
ncbi:hypothetical protein [Streptomyces sp. NPDC012888]|uniref:hypothetical protein n=1 Tax=Streptomyces sp. NPDC012888 TaxID=3364855 RepID=UPI0036B3546F